MISSERDAGSCFGRRGTGESAAVKRFVGICVILGVLGANLEGAADIARSGDPCCDGAALGVVTEHAAELGSEADADSCIVCTPLCHCGTHGSALFVDSPNGVLSTPSTVPAQIQARYTSFVDPPFLPPPIL